MSHIHHALQESRQENREIIMSFMRCRCSNYIETMLGRIFEAASEDWSDPCFFPYSHSVILSDFKDYLIEEEEKLECALRSVNYSIDELNTLVILTGGGRLEMVTNMQSRDLKAL